MRASSRSYQIHKRVLASCNYCSQPLHNFRSIAIDTDILYLWQKKLLMLKKEKTRLSQILDMYRTHKIGEPVVIFVLSIIQP